VSKEKLSVPVIRCRMRQNLIAYHLKISFSKSQERKCFNYFLNADLYSFSSVGTVK